MIIVYTPRDGEPEQYDVRDLLSSEASIVARTIDQTWPTIRDGLPADDLDAMRGVVWVLKKRHQPTLRFGEFDPRVDELTSRFDKTEVQDWVDAGFALRATDPNMTVDQVISALRQVEETAADPEHARAYMEKCAAEAQQGKDLAPAEAGPESAPEPMTSATSTSQTSEPSTSGSSATS